MAQKPRDWPIGVSSRGGQHVPVILSFADKRTQSFSQGRSVRAFAGFARRAQLKLDMLESAVSLRDLAVLPGNRLQVLRGDRQGQYSIRINDQWRLCFCWFEGDRGPSHVQIVDYH